ncbi:MAG: SlyX family protein [Candidatus Accumulibacter sp.]|nr:SlyX family protein [Accumulibacter sp.]
MEHRLTEVETRISLAEDLLEALNLTIYRQQQQIDSLQAQLRQLHRQCQDSQTNVGQRTPRDEIPPHY